MRESAPAVCEKARVVSQVKAIMSFRCSMRESMNRPACRVLLMTLLDGEELTTVVNHSQGLRHRDALDVITQIGDALSAAHQVGIVHCDLKPENVFVSKSRAVGVERWVELLDFGIAKVLSELAHCGGLESGGKSRNTAVDGTRADRWTKPRDRGCRHLVSVC